MLLSWGRELQFVCLACLPIPYINVYPFFYIFILLFYGVHMYGGQRKAYRSSNLHVHHVGLGGQTQCSGLVVANTFIHRVILPGQYLVF